DRPGVQGHHDPGGAASHHPAAGHPPRDRDGDRYRSHHDAGHRFRRALARGHAARHRRSRSVRARGRGAGAFRRPPRPAHDGDATQRRKPGRRLHVDGERPDPGGHRRQGHAVRGRDERRLLGPGRFRRHRHLFVQDPRTLRYRRRPGARPLPEDPGMSALPFGFDALDAILLIPAAAAAVLALVPGYRIGAGLNVLAALLTLLASLALLSPDRPEPGRYLFVDDLNVVFIVLTTFIAFTTSVFSATYIAHELEIGRLTPQYLRFYHAMYQALMFSMNLALSANNIGLLWVAIEFATLTTILMVGIYRTHEAVEAAWKYFILGSVGIALALFGTILIYLAAQPVIGPGVDAMVWTLLVD